MNINSKLNIGISLFCMTNLIYYFNLFNYFIFAFDIVCIIELIMAYNNNNNIQTTSRFKLLYSSYGILLCCLSYYTLFEFSDKLLLNIVLISTTSDICQYAIGYNLGTHYVSQISPKKTYEGYLAGIGSAVLYSYCIKYTFIDIHLSLNVYIICVVYASMGDVISSYFKRQLCIKDWSNLLGQQGGFIDRGNSTIGLALYFLTSYKEYV